MFIHPGVIEGFGGPMASGKSAAVLKRIDPLRWISGARYIGFKPGIDKREHCSRSSKNFVNWIYVSDSEEILDHVQDYHDIVAMDEAQFFDEGIVSVVSELQAHFKNVIFAGLDSDFRGEPFGEMKELMFRSNEFEKLHAICPSCGDKAYYTQRLIDGEPAHYDSPIISIEGEKAREKYEPRCFRHHIVPGRR